MPILSPELKLKIEPTLLAAPASAAAPHDGLPTSTETGYGENLSATPTLTPEKSDDETKNEELERLRASATSSPARQAKHSSPAH